MRLPHLAISGILLVTLAACGGRDITLRDLSNPAGGPEEFAIVPSKPLEMPERMDALPTPAPGSANRTDLTPKADAVAALGGNRALLGGEGIPAGDAGLVRHASRYGVPGGIRQTLAEEDRDFRTRKSRFTNIRLVRVDRYNQAYRRQTLDPYQALEAYRRAGAYTPSAPPSVE